MKSILKLPYLVPSIIVLVIVVFMAVYLSAQFSRQYSSGLVQEKINLFMKSDKQEIRLVELFPWEWEFMCTTGDYASRRAFETALGRNATAGDYLTWYWYGRWFFGVENVDNFIFEKNGKIDIYQYEFLHNPSFGLPISVRSRGHCIQYSKTSIVRKIYSKHNANVVDSLTVIEHN